MDIRFCLNRLCRAAPAPTVDLTDPNRHMTRILYLDCYSGAAGDMILSALVDAGADQDRLRTAIQSLSEDPIELTFERVRRKGADGLHLQLDPPDDWSIHAYPALRNRLTNTSLSDGVIERSTAALDRLADAEARFHGCEPEEVHFHEIAGFDLLMDLAGAAVCLDELDIDRVCYPGVPVGSGSMDTHHGRLPIPAPATTELLDGKRVYHSGLDEEMTTPTGAAILTTMAEQVDGLPELSVRAIGYGAGTKSFDDRPNLLRAVRGTTEDEFDSLPEHVTAERVSVLKTNIDDGSPEEIAHALERLLDKGALDAFVTPITMKKSRSASELTVLCRPTDTSRMIQLLLDKTSTFGVRTDTVRRAVLPRTRRKVDTPWGPVPVKIGRLDAREKIAPEFDACRRIAEEQNCSLQEVMHAARRAYADGPKQKDRDG